MTDTIDIPLADLAEIGATVEFPVLKKKRRMTAFALRHDEGLAVYANLCPHFGSPLTESGSPAYPIGNVTCAVHGAIFDAKTGLCSSGPCVGTQLTPIDYSIEGEVLRVPTQIHKKSAR